MRPRNLLLAAALGCALPTIAAGQGPVASQAGLTKFSVTIRRFDPAGAPGNGQTFVLPVDSPDEEHAIASTLANAASFSRKADAGKALPVAFMAVAISRR